MCPISSDNMQAYVHLLISLFVPCREEITHHFAPLVNTVQTYKKTFCYSLLIFLLFRDNVWLFDLVESIISLHNFKLKSFQVFLVTGCRHPLLRNLYYRPQLRTQFKRLQTGPGTRLIAFSQSIEKMTTHAITWHSLYRSWYLCVKNTFF